MSADLQSLSDDDARQLLLQSREMLATLAQSLNERPDMLVAIRELMSASDMPLAYQQQAEDSPDVLRLVLQASIAALVNVHSVHALDAEFKRRAITRN